MDGSLAAGNLGCGHEGSPLSDVDGIGDNQPNVTIDTRATVPARRRLGRSVGADGEGIRLSIAEIGMPGQFVLEADVAERPMAKLEAVDPDIAVGHDAVELDEDAALGIIGGQREMFAIPANAARQKGA